MKVFFIRGRLCGLCLMISQLVSSGLSLSTQKCLGETAHVQFTQLWDLCCPAGRQLFWHLGAGG